MKIVCNLKNYIYTYISAQPHVLIMHIHCEVILSVKLISIFVTSQLPGLFNVMRTSKINPQEISGIQYRLVNLVTMLCIISPEVFTLHS